MYASKRDIIRRKSFGFVFQSIAIISIMSAYENVEFGLRIAGYNHTYRKQGLKSVLNWLDLGNVCTIEPMNFQVVNSKVAIARAISHKPGVILRMNQLQNWTPIWGCKL